jgi:hypothetical protein
MRKPFLVICIILLSAAAAFADKVSIDRFIVKENPSAKDEIAVVATDTANNTLEGVNGRFSFTVNGFGEVLKFEKGTSFYRHKLDRSSFLYIKHINDQGTHSSLYYVFKGEDRLIPVHISWMVLLAVPLLLLLLAYLFKRMIILAIVIFCLLLYYNHHAGLSVPTFFESIIDGLKGMLKV